MIATGVVLIVIALLLDVSLLYTVGGILVVVGLVLWLIAAVGGRYSYRYW
jgi:hypothetical protein